MENVLYEYGGKLIQIGIGFLVLAAGWVAAAILARGIRKLLLRQDFAQKTFGKLGITVEPERLARISTVLIFVVVMLLAAVSALEILDLKLITTPLNSLLERIFIFLPNLAGALGVIILAWVAATILRLMVDKGLRLARFDEKLAGEMEEGTAGAMSESLANAAFWLAWLFFLPGILEALGLTELLRPLQGMLDKLLSFLPNVLSAAIILVAGWFGAKVVRHVTANFFRAAGVDNLGEKAGIGQKISGKGLSEILASVVYILILLPVIIASFEALAIEAVSRPATLMLTTFVNALPAIFGAMVVLTVSYIVARVAARLITELLSNIGVNRLPEILGLKWNLEEEKSRPANIAGGLIMVIIILLAAIEAANLVGFTAVGDMIKRFSLLAGNILLGLAIFGIGLYLARLTGRTLDGMTENHSLMAGVAKTAILILAAAMGLMQMGVAQQIVLISFGLLLGALAVAGALAFGLGAREIAARELQSWLDQLRR